MKDSGVEWIGKIPNDWQIIKLKYLADLRLQNSFIDGDWIETPDITDYGIKYFTTGNVGDGFFKEQGNGHISEETFQRLNCKYVYGNDLIISRLNAPHGRSCIIPSSVDKCVVAVDNVILRTQHDKRFICYLTQCKGYQQSVKDKSSGTTMLRISRKKLGNILLPIPNIIEQNKIATYLDRKCSSIDSLISKQQESIEKLKAYKQSVITEAVTKGLDPDVPMKDCGVEWIGEIPEEWALLRIKNCVAEHKGGAWGDNENVAPENCICIRIPDMDYDNLSLKTDSFTIRSYDSSVIYKLRLQKGDLLVEKSGGGEKTPVGRTIMFDGDYTAVYANFIERFRCNENTFPKFLMYVMNAQYKCGVTRLYIKQTTGIQNFSISSFLNKEYIPFPSLTIQRRIAAYLDRKCSSIDAIISKKQSAIESLKEYKKSLIYEVVTGKREV